MSDSPQVYKPGPNTPAPTAAIAYSQKPARLSLEQKLPLLVAGLMLAVMGAISIASYVEMRATTRQMADERLVNLTQQVAALFAMSGQQSRTRATALSARPGVVAFVAARSAANRAAALTDLKWVDANPQSVVETQIVERNGKVLLSTGHAFDTASMADVMPVVGGDSVRIGWFRAWHDTLVFATSAAVKGSSEVFVVRWRRILLTEQTRTAIASIFGTWGTPYLGNPGGTGWVNFKDPVTAPPYDFASKVKVQTYTRGNAQYIAAAQVLAGTPWAIVLEVPMTTVLAPAGAFLKRFLLLGVLALGIALVAAWLVTRSVTKPILQLADSATALAAGDFARAVQVKRGDELGEIGQAFATLASEVQSTRQQLESKVLERTRDLNDALYRLHGAHESLVRRERLAFLGQLASGVGHELRNPLGVMTNSVYYLRTVLDDKPENVREYLDILSQQITLSEKIVGDLLDFARSKPPQRKPTSLTEISERTVARLGPLNGVTVHSELNGHLPAVLVDGEQVGQIVLNLLTNAVQAVDGRGTVKLRADVSDDRVQLEVVDSGPGVPAENLERVFEPLFTTKARGIGLGLAVSRALARANGGDLSAHNNVGGGAAFRLTLPVALVAN